MKTAASRLGALCLAASLLAGCESVDGFYQSAKNTIMGSDRSYIGRQVGGDLDEADALSIGRESAKALEHTRAGKTVSWSNPASGTSAVITPGDTVMEKRKIKTARGKAVAPASGLVLIGKIYKARKNANLRAGPNTKHPTVGGLAAGEKFIAVGKVARGDWIMVEINGKVIGYVFGSLVRPVKRTPDLRESGDAPKMAAKDHGGDVVVETITVSTACRDVNYTVRTADGESAKEEFRACRASDGAWEIN